MPDNQIFSKTKVAKKVILHTFEKGIPANYPMKVLSLS